MLTAASTASSSRFNEVRVFLTEIGRLESSPPQPDSDIVVIMRGLFFVHLYGAFEYSITSAVQELLRTATALRIPYHHLEQLFYAIALDSGFVSVADCGPRRKWIVRKDLLSKQASSAYCELNDTVFHKNLQNIWFETLVELFGAIGISDAVLPDFRFRLYIDEVVDKRNAIAHGRESALVVGRMRSSDLEIRYNAVSSTATYVIDCLGRFLTTKAFVSSAHRARY